MVVWQLVARYFDPSLGFVTKRSREVYGSEEKALDESSRFDAHVRDCYSLGSHYDVEVEARPLEVIE